MYDNLIVLYGFIFPSTSLFFFFLYPRGEEPEFDAQEEMGSFHTVLLVWCQLSS